MKRARKHDAAITRREGTEREPRGKNERRGASSWPGERENEWEEAAAGTLFLCYVPLDRLIQAREKARCANGHVKNGTGLRRARKRARDGESGAEASRDKEES